VESPPFDFPTPTPLPGDRLLFEGIQSSQCYTADSEVAMDLISGCWSFEFDAILEPSGVFLFSGTATSADLTYWEGEDPGGWVGPFHATFLPDGKFNGSGKNEGWGELEGWRMKHQEDEFGNFFGHFKLGH